MLKVRVIAITLRQAQGDNYADGARIDSISTTVTILFRKVVIAAHARS
jgi:hypothetical protein